MVWNGWALGDVSNARDHPFCICSPFRRRASPREAGQRPDYPRAVADNPAVDHSPLVSPLYSQGLGAQMVRMIQPRTSSNVNSVGTSRRFPSRSGDSVQRTDAQRFRNRKPPATRVKPNQRVWCSGGCSRFAVGSVSWFRWLSVCDRGFRPVWACDRSDRTPDIDGDFAVLAAVAVDPSGDTDRVRELILGF